MMYVDQAKEQAVIFNYLVNNRYGAGSKFPVKFKGLNSTKKYMVKETNLYPGTNSTLGEGEVYSGDFLMNVGFNPDVRSGRNSVILVVNEVGLN